MTISDTRLSHLMSPDYAKSEAGQLAAELYAARQDLRIVTAERDDAERLENCAHERAQDLTLAVLHYGHHDLECDFIQGEIRCTCGFEALRATLTGEGEGK